ncbi:hypothetical protein ILUMI_16169, partial [Ignelater luminosus]
MPCKVAQFLNIKNPEAYTGGSFGRTSTTLLENTRTEGTLLANKGVSILGLKWHGGWKSLAVAEKYVKDSPRNKIQYGERILHVGNKLSSLSSAKFS